MATIENTYNKWRASLSKPDDSLFYYHPSLERILLGFAIYVIGSQSLVVKLGKVEYLRLLHIYIPELITAWIDENEKQFETMFPLTMKLAEIFMVVASGSASEYPSKKKEIKKLQAFYAHAVSAGGDMTSALAEELLNDFSTDGKTLYSDKITAFGKDLLLLTTQYGTNFPYSNLQSLIGR